MSSAGVSGAITSMALKVSPGPGILNGALALGTLCGASVAASIGIRATYNRKTLLPLLYFKSLAVTSAVVLNIAILGSTLRLFLNRYDGSGMATRAAYAVTRSATTLVQSPWLILRSLSNINAPGEKRILFAAIAALSLLPLSMTTADLAVSYYHGNLNKNNAAVQVTASLGTNMVSVATALGLTYAVFAVRNMTMAVAGM